ncbi:MAG: D-isomer specific 2-hydroxyacid dehydrogenase NAD-binding protein [Candidatus Nomurabacteria bacterium GW2011_GWB1_37_5]|uniref:D-isomer specific 2-hydroxyacid dehydrogenase NAD-binding protein n=1 Tax=Candidatus Nomurabacteria bacterium GW2011_GWB1_37_5 TaxID=1618742 RepID=A0A0G0GWL2_9BACT|nr:MAG: D-isomer specific 2-hydroxyacid dehydrogenase NAD-binding protein [Candidatus Nomurabacteria bacterium GW2011_GWB1_37_5]
MRIVFFETNKEEEKILKGLLPEIDAVFSSEKLSLDNVSLAKDAEIMSVFINSEISKEIIDQLPLLKFISTRSTGFDHIDHIYAESKNIVVSNVPAYGSRTVAEHTFALLLEFSRKAGEANRQIKAENNFDIEIMQFKGFDLFGKTIGVIGTGKIGKNVCRIAKGFGMKILATDLYPDYVFAEELGVEYIPLTELLSASDIVTIHTPYNETTFHLINKENIKQFKKGAYLINTARGEIVETEALVSALKDGTLAGTGLDVLEGERQLKSEKNIGGPVAELIQMPNVVVTPHIAFCTTEAIAEILKVTTENIKSFSAGTPQNLVK